MTDIYSDHQSRCFCLVVAGLPYRYHSGPSPAPYLGGFVSSVGSGGPYTDVPAITSVGSYGAQLDPIGGVATYQPITISLAVDRLGGGTSDPAIVFGRLGYRATAVTSAPLRASILHQDTAPLTIQIDGTGFASGSPQIIHIGGETMSTLGGVSHGTWEEVNVTERGAGGTQIQNHLINDIGLIPEVTKEIVSWRTRRATLYTAQLRADGTTGPYTEVMRGFIDATPRLDDPVSMSLDLVPLTALLDDEIASQRGYSTSLAHGYHHFTGSSACVIEHAQGTMPSERAGADWPQLAGRIRAVPAANTVTMDPAEHAHAEIFDITLDARHPRSGKFAGLRTAEQATPPTAYDPALPPHSGYVFPAGFFPAAPVAGDTLYMLPAVEVRRHEIKVEGSLAESIAWPGGVVDGFNAAQAAVHTGVGGSWLRLNLSDVDTAEPKLSARWNTGVSILRGGVGVAFWTTTILAAQNLIDERNRIPQRWDPAGGPWPLTTSRRLLTYPIDWAPVGDDHYPLDDALDPTDQTQRLYEYIQPSPGVGQWFIRGIAKAFYQYGEEYILTAEPLALPTVTDPDSNFYLQVKYYDRAEGQVRTRMIKALNSNAVTVGGVVVGYAVEVDPYSLPPGDRCPSFGDWHGQAKTEISLGSYLEGLTPAEIVLMLLLSSGGGGVNHPDYDRLAFGAGLRSDDIDIPTIEAMVPPQDLDTWRMALPADGVSVKEIIDPILKALGYALVMRRTAAGKCVLSASAIGAEYAATSAGTIGEGDWLSDTPLLWGNLDTIVNSLEVLADYDPETEEYRSEITVNDQRSIGALSGETRKLTLSLPGLELRRGEFVNGSASLALLRPTFSRLFRLYGAPVRTFTGAIGTGQGFRGEVGSVYTVSSPYLRDYGDGWGVDGVRAMVTESTIDLMGEGALVVMHHHGINAAGWNASALVSSIDTPSSMIIQPVRFSGGSPTGDDLYDINGLVVGGKVDHLPAGDHDSRVTLTVQSIDPGLNRVVFTVAHGIAVAGGTLEPPTYDDAPDQRQAEGYLSDSQNKLGALNDEGYVYL